MNHPLCARLVLKDYVRGHICFCHTPPGFDDPTAPPPTTGKAAPARCDQADATPSSSEAPTLVVPVPFAADVVPQSSYSGDGVVESKGEAAAAGDEEEDVLPLPVAMGRAGKQQGAATSGLAANATVPELSTVEAEDLLLEIRQNDMADLSYSALDGAGVIGQTMSKTQYRKKAKGKGRHQDPYSQMEAAATLLKSTGSTKKKEYEKASDKAAKGVRAQAAAGVEVASLRRKHVHQKQTRDL